MKKTLLPSLYYQTKTQELIYLLFSKLLSRTSVAPNPINTDDARKIYGVRTAILRDLSKTPQFPELAKAAGITLTRMKQLFRQVFGDSIYNYYQSARMHEAARLLARLTVSETGYQLGFNNLSHFSRLFENHNRLKPKKHTDTLVAG